MAVWFISEQNLTMAAGCKCMDFRVTNEKSERQGDWRVPLNMEGEVVGRLHLHILRLMGL